MTLRSVVWGLLVGFAVSLVPAPSFAQTGPARPKRAPFSSGASEKTTSAPPARPRGSDAPSLKPQEDAKNRPVTVDANQMESFKRQGLIIFTGNVVARQNSSTQYADRMEVYLDEKGEKVLRSVSTGNVRIITKDCRTGTARRAEYDDAEQRVVLIGNAKVWEEDNVVTGERITIFLAEDRSIVQGGDQSRVRAVFYPKDDKKDTQKRVGGTPECR